MHLLLETGLSLGDSSSKDLSLDLLRHLAEILWLREGDRLQHMAPILRNFLEKGKSQHASALSSYFILSYCHCMSFSYPPSLLGVMLYVEVLHVNSLFFFRCDVHLDYEYRKRVNRRPSE